MFQIREKGNKNKIKKYYKIKIDFNRLYYQFIYTTLIFFKLFYLLNNSRSSASTASPTLILGDINLGVSLRGRGPRVEGLPVVLESLVEDGSEEDCHRRPQQLQCCRGHPTVKQDLLADSRVELEMELWLYNDCSVCNVLPLGLFHLVGEGSALLSYSLTYMRLL